MEGIVSRSCTGPPEIGERHDDLKWRAVVGWNHTDDTPEGIKQGKIWCWVSRPPQKFQVFDQDFNRSPVPGDRRDCGVANFTMIRMFHPYWTHLGMVPHDMIWSDKARCRAKWHELMRQHRKNLGLPVDDSPEEYATRLAAGKNTCGRRRNRNKIQTNLHRYFGSAKDRAGAPQAKDHEDQVPEAIEASERDPLDESMFVS